VCVVKGHGVIAYSKKPPENAEDTDWHRYVDSARHAREVAELRRERDEAYVGLAKAMLLTVGAEPLSANEKKG